MPLATIELIETFDEPHHWMGYNFILSDKTKNITCKIENAYKCYEKWGVYTKSNLNDFIGAEYYSSNYIIKDKERYDELNIMIVTIYTSKGNIDIYLYNEHNGHYWHDVFIQSENGMKTISL